MAIFRKLKSSWLDLQSHWFWLCLKKAMHLCNKYLSYTYIMYVHIMSLKPRSLANKPLSDRAIVPQPLLTLHFLWCKFPHEFYLFSWDLISIFSSVSFIGLEEIKGWSIFLPFYPRENRPLWSYIWITENRKTRAMFFYS